MKASTKQKRFIQMAAYLLILAIIKPALAQKGFVGDGFGGRKWYKPGNFIAGPQEGPSAAIVNGQLYLWGRTLTGYGTPSTAPGNTGNSGYPAPYNPVDYTGAAVTSQQRFYVTPYAVAGMNTVKMYTTSDMVMGALKANGTAWLWSSFFDHPNNYYPVAPTPTQVLSDVYHMSVGQQHAAFVKTDGTVWSLGYNNNGNFGNGTTSTTSSTVTATQMTGMTNAVRVVAFYSDATLIRLGTLVLKRDGTLWIAGAGGVLVANSTNNTATQVPSLSNVVDIKAGRYHAAALTSSGEVYCWGFRYYGVLGNGEAQNQSNTTYQTVPQKVQFPAGTPPMVAIETSNRSNQTYAIDEEGKLWVWGYACNLSGIGTDDSYPVPVISARHVTDVSLYGNDIAYMTRSNQYPPDQRIWRVGGTYKVQALNPNEIGPLSYQNGANYFPDYNSSGMSEDLYSWLLTRPTDAGLPDGVNYITPTTSVTGTVDCGTASIIGNLVPGKPSDVMLKITAMVSTTGTGTFTVSGSGLTTKDSPETFTADATGSQTFYLPMSYDGSALGSTTFTLSGLGSCSADLSGLNKRTVPTPITPLVNCVPFTSVTLSK